MIRIEDYRILTDALSAARLAVLRYGESRIPALRDALDALLACDCNKVKEWDETRAAGLIEAAQITLRKYGEQ